MYRPWRIFHLFLELANNPRLGDEKKWAIASLLVHVLDECAQMEKKEVELLMDGARSSGKQALPEARATFLARIVQDYAAIQTIMY